MTQCTMLLAREYATWQGHVAFISKRILIALYSACAGFDKWSHCSLACAGRVLYELKVFWCLKELQTILKARWN